MLVGIRKEFKISKVIWVRSAPFPVRKTVARAHLRQISKKDEGRRKLSKMLGSSPFKKPHQLGRLKRLAKRTSVNYEMGAKLIKTETWR